MTTRVCGTPWNACATALPVSPEVADEHRERLAASCSAAISRAITRAPTSLNASVGP